MRARVSFWVFFSIILPVCLITLGQEIQERPKGYIDEIKKDGNAITFLSMESESDQGFMDFYKLIIGKVREKYDSTALDCNIAVTAEIFEKKVGQKIYRLTRLKIDVKGKKQFPEMSMPIPKSEEEISKLPKNEQSIYRTIREEQINKSLNQLLSLLSCF